MGGEVVIFAQLPRLPNHVSAQAINTRAGITQYCGINHVICAISARMRVYWAKMAPSTEHSFWLHVTTVAALLAAVGMATVALINHEQPAPYIFASLTLDLQCIYPHLCLCINATSFTCGL